MPGPEAARALLIEAARAGAEEAMRHFGKAPRVWDKGDGQGPVSAADLAVDALLRERLLAARPDHGWLSEETPDTGRRMGHERCFIVDPIDGTTSFLRGRDGWSISLALVERGEPVAGVVMMPATGRVYSAARGGGAWCDGEPMRLAAPASRPSIAIPRNQLGSEYWPDGADWLAPAPGGALSLRLTRLAEGDVEGTVTFRPVWEWDVAAGVVIAQEAGAVLSDRTGGALRFNSASARLDGLIAAGAGLHPRILAHAGATAPNLTAGTP